MKRELCEHRYNISEISIDMNRECARFTRSIILEVTSTVTLSCMNIYLMPIAFHTAAA